MIYTLLYVDNQNQKNTISFDCITNASESYSSTVTEHPVESGRPISDHVHHKNIAIEIEGVVSDYNISNPRKGGNLVKFVDGEIIADSAFPLSPTTLIREQLLFVHNNKLGCTIIVGRSGDEKLLEYRNCILTGLRFTDGAGNGEAVYVSMSFTPIRVATTRTQIEGRVPDRLLKAAVPTAQKDETGITSTADTLQKMAVAPKDTNRYVDPEAAKTLDRNIARVDELKRLTELAKGGQ